MPQIDHHKDAYRPATKTKLELFENYLREWLPVFLKSSYYMEANIIDFFSGPGEDKAGEPGSPLRTLKTVKEFYEASSLQVDFKQKKLNIIFNEADKEKYERLKEIIENFRAENEISDSISIQVENKKFETLFPELNPRIKNQFNLYFIDQSGLEHANQETFSDLCKNKRTDFLLFLAASAANRFKDVAQKVLNLDDVTMSELESNDDFYQIHEILTNGFRRKAQEISSDFYIIPFSLKQVSNLYGVIFGSHNILGADKFLSSAWSISTDGSSNLDQDIIEKMKKKLEKKSSPGQSQLFAVDELRAEQIKGEIYSAKINQLENKINEHLQNCPKTNNLEIYRLTINSGFLAKHANELLLGLKNDCNLEFMKDGKRTRSPGIGYKQTKDSPTVEIIKNG